ncbi:hypothetical protein COB87_001725 [Candidatus Wolfebacteria bacterium]|nr:hypothetical protein [Candidatus Wolfebacteria bacterium]
MQNYLNVEYIFFLIYNLLTGGGSFTGSDAFYASEFYSQLVTIWGTLTFVATIITLILLTVLLYSAFRLRAIRAINAKFYADAIIVPDDPGKEPATRWEGIEALYDKGGESNWRQAIIEADIMLDDMLTVQGYDGATVGEKLKTVEEPDFNTLQYAWAAHKVRNNIAHQGQDFILTEREARQTMRWFEQVFAEFKFQ